MQTPSAHFLPALSPHPPTRSGTKKPLVPLPQWRSGRPHPAGTVCPARRLPDYLLATTGTTGEAAADKP